MKANVFIVWGGNKELADRVSEKIQDHNEFNVQVGGEDPNALFIGTTVLQQIQMSSIAIILVQNSDKTGNGYMFRPNLMFEWGYIIANFKPKNVHVFLMDMEEKNLPSDLRGSWAKTINTENKALDEIAREIAEKFRHDYHEQNINKLYAFEKWNESIKSEIREHTSKHIFTDREMAAIIIYAFQASYYYHEIKNLRDWILHIRTDTRDSVLKQTISIVIGALDYYILKEQPVNLSTGSEFYSLVRRMNQSFDISKEDLEINKWLHIISNNFMGLCYNRMSDLDIYNEHQKQEFLNKAKEYFERVLSYLDENQLTEEIKTDNTTYSTIWRGYVYRNIAVVYAKLNDQKRMTDYLDRAADARQSTETYFSENDTDKVLMNNFKLENIMIRLEKMKFTKEIDDIEIKLIQEQMVLLDHEFANQNILYTNICRLLQSLDM